MTDYKRERTDVIAQAVEDGELDRAEAGEILVTRALRKLAKRKAQDEPALVPIGSLLWTKTEHGSTDLGDGSVGENS